MAVDKALAEIDRALSGGDVITDRDILESYSRDESEVTPVIPAACVRATSTAEVAAVMRAASAHGVPVTPRSGGTGRVGGSVPVPGGIVLAFERMDGIDEIDRRELSCVVRPGLVTGKLHEATEAERLFYGPDPNSSAQCAIGGNVACNAGGPRAFKYGVTREWVLGLEVVTADGTVLELGKTTRKGVTGYDLCALVVGSEGTLGVVTRARLRLAPLPERIGTLLVLLSDLTAVERVVTTTLGRGVVPRCIELLDGITLDAMRGTATVPIPAEARAMLILELDGDARVVDADVERVGNWMREEGALEVLLARNSSDRERIWGARREMSRTLRGLAKNKLSEDVVVPRTKIAALLDGARRISEATRVVMPTYGHAGDGNLHVNFLWNTPDEKPAVDRAIHALFEEVVRLGGTLSGEHGIGVLKAPYLPLEQSPALIALEQRVKDAFDPKRILNPGKIFPDDARRFHGAC